MGYFEENTNGLWKQFSQLLNTILLIVLFVSFYMLLESQFSSLFSHPKYTDEQLAAFAKSAEESVAKGDADDWDRIKNGIHVRTGLKADENVNIVIAACTSCHSAKLITQNRATLQGWKTMINWMQETQGLADLGSREPIILNYLAKHYAPVEVGRRSNLNMEEVEWYILNLDH